MCFLTKINKKKKIANVYFKLNVFFSLVENQLNCNAQLDLKNDALFYIYI